MCGPSSWFEVMHAMNRRAYHRHIVGGNRRRWIFRRWLRRRTEFFCFLGLKWRCGIRNPSIIHIPVLALLFCGSNVRTAEEVLSSGCMKAFCFRWWETSFSLDGWWRWFWLLSWVQRNELVNRIQEHSNACPTADSKDNMKYFATVKEHAVINK